MAIQTWIDAGALPIADAISNSSTARFKLGMRFAACKKFAAYKTEVGSLVSSIAAASRWSEICSYTYGACLPNSSDLIAAR